MKSWILGQGVHRDQRIRKVLWHLITPACLSFWFQWHSYHLSLNLIYLELVLLHSIGTLAGFIQIWYNLWKVEIWRFVCVFLITQQSHIKRTIELKCIRDLRHISHALIKLYPCPNVLQGEQLVTRVQHKKNKLYQQCSVRQATIMEKKTYWSILQVVYNGLNGMTMNSIFILAV